MHKLPINSNFILVDIGEPPVEMPESVQKYLSNDQKYLYEIVKIIKTTRIMKGW